MFVQLCRDLVASFAPRVHPSFPRLHNQAPLRAFITYLWCCAGGHGGTSVCAHVSGQPMMSIRSPDQLKGHSTMHMNRVDCTVRSTSSITMQADMLPIYEVLTPYLVALVGVASCRMFLGGRCSSEALSVRNSLM